MKKFLRQAGRLAIRRSSQAQNLRFASTQPASFKQPVNVKHLLGNRSSPIILRDAYIPPNIQAIPQEDNSGNWTVRWKNDIAGYEDHVSTYTAADIARCENHKAANYHPATTKLWDNKTFQSETSPVTYDGFMNTDSGLAQVLLLFRRHGLVFINDVPAKEDSVAQIATRIGPLRSSFYGNTWNVRSVPQAKNVAYTSKYLGFHMDLLYMKESPTAQFLHCLENACTGGESRFVDTMKAFDILCHEYPEHASELRKMYIRYEYDNDGQFFTDTKPIIETRKRHDFLQRALQGAVSSGVNDVARVYWSPPFVGSVNGMSVSPHETAKGVEAANVLAHLFEREDLVYETKMTAGTCVIFDNLRVLHARNAFDMNSGSRWLRGCYLDGQDVISREFSLKDKISELASKF